MAVSKFNIGDKVTYNERWHTLYGLVGVIHSESSFHLAWGTRWWVFFPDKLNNVIGISSDPIIGVSWSCWEDTLIPYEEWNGKL